MGFDSCSGGFWYWCGFWLGGNGLCCVWIGSGGNGLCWKFARLIWVILVRWWVWVMVVLLMMVVAGGAAAVDGWQVVEWLGLKGGCVEFWDCSGW